MKQLQLHYVMMLSIIIGAMNVSHAQTCNAEMLNETGTVLSAKKGQHAIFSTANTATVKIRKTGGRAKTDVRVYVDGQEVPSSELNFANGNYTTTYRTLNLNNVEGKNIMVHIDNRSVGHTFGYQLVIEGQTRSLMNPAVVQTDKISGPGRKSRSFTTRATCGNKVRVIVRLIKTKSSSQWAYIRIYEKDSKSSGGWKRLTEYDTHLSGQYQQRIFVVNSKKELRIEVLENFLEDIWRNIEFSVNALSIN